MRKLRFSQAKCLAQGPMKRTVIARIWIQVELTPELTLVAALTIPLTLQVTCWCASQLSKLFSLVNEDVDFVCLLVIHIATFVK
jgi:hypothetical protein